ncbi:hypothetical protein BCR44DRAFT_47926 [Catenaria anguillulae PL171]|uniref:DUF4211 domain-containing protein n=1 Tax=Catenaria anguillulae PL171 TaxID=765915 RepID=A0A1Y2HHN0_9FUNG|nr:hypothetical protein BCR44DRAFT_47926 [Catenaria anguillulae PL171]
MSSSRRPTALNPARANALQLLMDKARARAGKPAAPSPIAPAAASSTTPHTPTKRKLVSRAQREASSVQSSPQVGYGEGGRSETVKAEQGSCKGQEDMGEEETGDEVEEDNEERSPIKPKRRRLNDSADSDPSSTPIKVKAEPGSTAVSDDWLAFGDDVGQQTAVKSEPNGEELSPASSPTAGRRPRRLQTKSALERKAKQQREEAMALAEEFDVDEENIVESPRKSRRGGIRDRIERARNRGELSMDTSERLPASITNEGSDGDQGGDDQHDGSDSDSGDDLIIIPKLEPTPFSRPSLDRASDSDGDQDDGDDSWIVNDDEMEALGDEKPDADSDADSIDAPLAFHNLDNLQWYTLYLEYMARLVLNPTTYRRLEFGMQRPDEQDDPLAAAYRKVKDMIQLRLKSMYSTVWREHLLDTIHSHPLCRRTSNPAQDLCEACNRAERNTCARLTFRGSPYDPNTFRPLPSESGSESESADDAGASLATRSRRRRIASDSDSDAQLDTKPTNKSNVRKLARSLVSPHYSVGRFCALRVHGYHLLYHAMYHTYQTVRDRMAQLAGASVFGSSGDWPPARISVEEGEMLLESLLTGPEGAQWVQERHDEFQGMLSEADDVLCNRVGALSKN